MSDVANQKRVSAAILKCGVNRVWFDPARISDIENAISRDDLRNLITDGAIKAHQKKGVSRGRARIRTAQRSYGHRKGAGKRKTTNVVTRTAEGEYVATASPRYVDDVPSHLAPIPVPKFITELDSVKNVDEGNGTRVVDR